MFKVISFVGGLIGKIKYMHALYLKLLSLHHPFVNGWVKYHYFSLRIFSCCEKNFSGPYT